MKNNEEGIISFFVLFAMLFLLVFSLTIYTLIKDKDTLASLQEIELQQIYYKDSNLIEENLYADEASIIPIYNAYEIEAVGTNNTYININNKIYECSNRKKL